MDSGVASINDQVKDASSFTYKLREEIGTVVVGQRYLVDRLLIGLLANGHVLLEGVPGLAKTLSVKTLAQAVAATFRRIQFTPDLLPADLIGTMIYNPRDGRDRSSRRSSSPTRSTGRPPRCRARFSRRCRSTR